MKIGFVGLGNMSGRLAARLASVGDLTVYDAHGPSREVFRDRARVAASVAEAGTDAVAVGVCVRTGEQDAVLSQNTPAGNWRVTVTLQSGITTRLSSAILLLGTVQSAGLMLTSRELLGGVLIAAVALWLAGFVLRRRRYAKPRARSG